MNELKHYGIGGMHWGVRRFQNEDGSLTPAGKERYATINSRIDKQKEKQDKKQAKREQIKKNVEKYSKSFNKASSMEDRSDELFDKAKKQYKALGSNFFKRVHEVSKAQRGKGSEAANEYLKTWEKASDLGDKAYDEWQRAHELYKKTGRNRIMQIVNNIKYDPDS